MGVWISYSRVVEERKPSVFWVYALVSSMSARDAAEETEVDEERELELDNEETTESPREGAREISAAYSELVADDGELPDDIDAVRD